VWRFSDGEAAGVSTLRKFGWFGVRREAEKPMTEDEEDYAMGERETLEAAQQALDEWRSIQHKPAEVERWAYRWAVDLCERLGAR
jgi:hypothetical protein